MHHLRHQRTLLHTPQIMTRPLNPQRTATMAKGFGVKGHEGKGHDTKYNNAKDNDEKGKEDPSHESTDNKKNKSQDKGDAEDSEPDDGKGKEKESTSEQPKDNKNKDNQDEGKPKLNDKVLPPEKTSKYKNDKSKSCSQWEAFKHRFKYGGTGYECSPENDDISSEADSSADEEEKARDEATKENTRKNNGRPKPEPPKDHENEPEDNENDTERPEEKKGEPKAKCVRWADYEQLASFLDNVPRTGRYDHKKVLLEHRKKKEQKKLQHLKCAADETRAALDRMEGKDSETTNDDETGRIIDGEEGEGERSTIYDKLKRLKEFEEGIIDLKDRWKVQDPKLRDKMREQAVEELGTLNHKLSTGDWIQEMNEGKPSSLWKLLP